MSTYTASKIRKSRKARTCVRDKQHAINPGDRYLSYAPGLYTRLDVCLPCALTTTNQDSTPRYLCADVLNELKKQQETPASA